MKKLILSFITAGAVLASAHSYADTVIIQDEFNTGSTDFSNRVPDTTDLPGATNHWTDPVNNYGEGVNLAPNSNAYIKGDGQAVIGLDSGSYTAPSELSISSAIYVDVPSNDGPERGVGLGFFSSESGGGDFDSNFDGLVLGVDGNLYLDVNGNETADGNVHSTYSGTWDVTATHYLSYDYDATTGAITDVILDGHDYSSTFAGYDLRTGDAYAGFNVTESNGGYPGYIADFVVSTPSVPEPTTDALFALGGCLVLAGWLRLRRSKA